MLNRRGWVFLHFYFISHECVSMFDYVCVYGFQSSFLRSLRVFFNVCTNLLVLCVFCLIMHIGILLTFTISTLEYVLAGLPISCNILAMHLVLVLTTNFVWRFLQNAPIHLHSPLKILHFLFTYNTSYQGILVHRCTNMFSSFIHFKYLHKIAIKYIMVNYWMLWTVIFSAAVLQAYHDKMHIKWYSIILNFISFNAPTPTKMLIESFIM